MRTLVLLNDAAGRMCEEAGSSLLQQVNAVLQEAGIVAEVQCVDHHQLELSAKEAAQGDYDCVVAGGGDGTLSTVAGALAGTGKVFGVLPLGTLNHFAKDLNIPLDLIQACETIARGNTASIDVGMVNERVFLNNSSLGVYPRAVLERESQRRRRKLRKWTAMLWAVFKTFRRFPLITVRVEDEDGQRYRRTPLVFVGNNHYQLDLLTIGQRLRLTDGKLSLYVANTQSRWGILKLALRALVGRLRQARDFEDYELTECWIETRKRKLHVALDGEVLTLRPPLHYRVWPAALQVLVPGNTQASSTEQSAVTSAGMGTVKV